MNRETTIGLFVSLLSDRQDRSPVTLGLKVENARAALKRCPFGHSAAVSHSPGYEAP
jgi:hypothetical protein